MNNSDEIKIATIVSENAAIEVGIYVMEARDHIVVFAEIAKILHPFMLDIIRRADALEDKAKEKAKAEKGERHEQN